MRWSMVKKLPYKKEIAGKYEMKVVINGKTRELSQDGITVRKLLELLDIKNSMIAVEVNREIVGKDGYGGKILNDGDDIEILQIVGGG